MPKRSRRGRGEGSVYQRNDGVWCCSISLGFNAEGKRLRPTVTGESKKEVMEKVAALKEEFRVGGTGASDRTKLGPFLARWLEIKERSVEPRTVEQYELHVRKHITPRLGNVRVRDLTTLHVEDFLTALEKDGTSRAMQGKILTTLRTALKYAWMKAKILTHNPAAEVDKPKHSPPEVTVIEPQQVRQFFDAARSDRLYAYFVLLLDSGARPGEICALQWADVDFDDRTIRITKAQEETPNGQIRIKVTKTKKSRRMIVVSAFCVEALKGHLEAMQAERVTGPSDLVFCDTEGGPLRRPNTLRRHFRPIIQKAGLPDDIRPYDLRHSLATILLVEGESPKLVAERLGHSTTKQTMDTYSHVIKGMQERAADKLDTLFREPKSGEETEQKKRDRNGNDEIG